ncbi:MAG: DegT/DnrJ/EryC1/StrS aminotransferase family protein [candidate division Zixibacteria bacterium]|nr:DegT/DnrJ/EryC1/StrS aminotransferase family protein [candidate division Zixibacteria bacterium]
MNWKIPLFDLDYNQKEISAVSRVLRNRWLTMGERVEEFENKFAEFLKARYAIALSSGTAALHLALESLGIKKGDEVLVPAMTFVASANAVLYCGAKPVFVDSASLEDFNISITDLEKKISSKTRGIVVVHYGGFVADMEKINWLADKHDLFVIEDSAHSIGTKYGSKMAGAFGDIGCFSFFSNKNLATGEGGMIVTHNQKLARKIRLLRTHGMTRPTWERFESNSSGYDIIELGYNYRMTEISAVLGLEQLKKLECNNHKRKLLTQIYIQYLGEIQEISIPFKDHPGDSSHHLFPILLDKNTKREAFMHNLKLKGIQTGIHYQPVHKFSYYRKNFPQKSGTLSISEEIGKREVSLPLHPRMSEDDVVFICQQIKKILSR